MKSVERKSTKQMYNDHLEKHALKEERNFSFFQNQR